MPGKENPYIGHCIKYPIFVLHLRKKSGTAHVKNISYIYYTETWNKKKNIKDIFIRSIMTK